MQEPDDIVDSILKLKRLYEEGDESCKHDLVLQLTLLKYKIGSRFDELPAFASMMRDLTKEKKK